MTDKLKYFILGWLKRHNEGSIYLPQRVFYKDPNVLVFSNGIDSACIEVVGGELIDMNILSSSHRKDKRYWKLVKWAEAYVYKRFGIEKQYLYGKTLHSEDMIQI